MFPTLAAEPPGRLAPWAQLVFAVPVGVEEHHPALVPMLPITTRTEGPLGHLVMPKPKGRKRQDLRDARVWKQRGGVSGIPEYIPHSRCEKVAWEWKMN